ncbi:MAG: hypothetical protein OXU44_00560, partial [Gammaproteobacteria bacterium]|nr:hypothetical protein [Gammaproteobacteria bacterium]
MKRAHTTTARTTTTHPILTLLLTALLAIAAVTNAQAQGTYTIGWADNYSDEYGLGSGQVIITPALTVSGSGTLTEDLRVVYWTSETSQNQVSRFSEAFIWPSIEGGTAQFEYTTFTAAQVAAAAADGTLLRLPDQNRQGSINEGAGYRLNLVQSAPSPRAGESGTIYTFGAGAADTITVAVNRPNGAVYERPSGTAVPVPAGVIGFGASGRSNTTGSAIAASGHIRENRGSANRLMGWTTATVRVREGEAAILPLAMRPTDRLSLGGISASLTISTGTSTIQPIVPTDIDVFGGPGITPDGMPDSVFLIRNNLNFTIPFGRRSAQFAIPIIDDDLEEPEERFVVEITSSFGAAVGTDTGIITVIIAAGDTARTVTATATGNNGDRDATAPGLQVHEGDVVTLVRAIDGLSDGLLPVVATISGTAATDGSDFTTSAQNADDSYRIPVAILRPTGLSRSYDITIVDDNIAEEDETIILTISADDSTVPDIVTVATTMIAITIVDTDVGPEPGTLGIASDIDRDATTPGVQINEGDGVTLTYTANGLTSGEFDVQFRVRAVSGGGAISADDITGVQFPGQPNARAVDSLPYESLGVLFSSAFPTGDVLINTANDTAAEGDETFVVETYNHMNTNPNVQFTTPASVTITVLANDGNAFSIVADAASVAESAGTATFSVRLAGEALGSGASHSVDWAASGAGITAADIGATSGTLTFTDNGRQALAIAVTDDTESEGNETLIITLDNPVGGAALAADSSSARTTILDNDAPVTATVIITAGQSVANEGDSATFTVSLTGGASAGSVTTAPFTITAADAGGLGLNADDFDITSPAGIDAAETMGEVVITAGAGGAGSATIALQITDDNTGEGPETLLVSLLQPQGAALLGAPSTAMLTINRSDVRVGFERTFFTQSEGVGQFQVCVTVTQPPRSQPLDDMFSLSVSSRAGTAASGTDYTAITNQRVGPFSNSRRQECFLVEVADNMVFGNPKNFFLDLAPPPGETLGGVSINPSQATITITDDDPVVVGWAQASSNVTVNEASGTVVLTAVILAPAADVSLAGRDDFSLVVNTMDGAAVAGADYTALSNVVIGPFGDNARSATATVAITDDGLAEPVESFTAVLGFAAGAPQSAAAVVTQAAATLTIADDDPARMQVVQVSPDGAADEGASVAFRVEVSGGELPEAVSLRWSVTTATDAAVTALPADFGDGNASEYPSGDVTINAGARASPPFTVALFDDNLNERAEQYNVELDEVDDARYPREALTGAVITDNDPLAVSFVPPPPGTRLVEGSTQAFTVGVTGPAQGSSATVIVTFGGDAAGDAAAADVAITAIGGQDLAVPATSPLTLTVESTRTFTLRITDDNFNEGEERLTLALSQPTATGGIELGAVTRVEVVIEPSDPMTATLSANAATARETGDANFTVALDGGVPSVGAVVTYDFTVVQNHTSGGVAATIDQHPGRPDIIDRGQGRATIAAGATHGAIVLNIHRDGYEESTETLTLTLQDITAAGPAAFGDATTATVEIVPSGTPFRLVRARLGGPFICPDAVDGFFGVPGSPATLGTCTDFREHVPTLPQVTSDGVAIYYEPAGTSGGAFVFANVTVVFDLLEGTAFSGSGINIRTGIRLISDDAESAARLGAVPADGNDRTGGTSGGAVASSGISFALSGDRFNEGTETFVVQVDIRDYNEDANDGDGAYVDEGTVIEYETPVSGSFGIAAFRGVILDHPEDTLIASVADAAVTEGATASFTVTLGGATATADTTVPYSVVADAPVNPVAAGEIDAREGVLTIPQGSQTVVIFVPTANADNELNQADRHFTVNLLPGVASRGAATRSETASSALGAITDDDDLFIESVAPVFDGDAVEGDIAAFLVTASNPSADEFALRWSASAGGASQPLQPCAAADLCFVPGQRARVVLPATGAIGGEVRFAARTTTTEFSFIVNQDGVAEPRESLGVQIDPNEVSAGPLAGVITPAPSAATTASVSLHIAANDAAMRLLTAGDLSWMRLREGDVASFDVSLSGTTPTSVVTVRWAVDADAAADPNAGGVNLAEASDYAPAAGELRFTPANFTEPQTAHITITDDDLNESTETLTVRLFGQMGGDLPTTPTMAAMAMATTATPAAQVTGTVVMNIRQSDPLSWALSAAPPAEADEDAGELRYEITLSRPSEDRIEFPVIITGTAAAGADDDPARDVTLPSATTTTAVFAIGATRTAITLELHDDDEFERPETVIVELPAAGAPGVETGARTGFATRAPRTADHRAVTIIRDNDDAVVTLEGGAGPVAEGATASFTVTLTGAALGLDVEVPYRVGIAAQASTGTSAQNTAANPDFTPGFTPGAATTGVLAIAAGTTQTTVTYQIVRDGIAENDETLQFGLHPPPGGNVRVSGATTAGVVIQSAELPGRLSAAPAPGYDTAVAEGGAIAWRIAVAPTGSTTPETLVLHYAVVNSDGNAAGIGGDIGFADGRVFGGATRTVVGHVPATQTFIETTPELTVYRDGVLEDAETLFLAVSLGVTGTIPASDQAVETLQMTLPLTDGRVDAPLVIAASDGPPQPLLTTLPAAPENST